MKTGHFLPSAISFFWLSGTCQGCSDWVADTSGEMVKSWFQWRGEQGNSWKHIYVIWSDESLPMTALLTISQTAHTRPQCEGLGHTFQPSKTSARPTWKCTHKLFPSHTRSQEPAPGVFWSQEHLGFAQVPEAYAGCRELNYHLESQQGKHNCFISVTGSTLFNTMGRTWHK